MAPDQEWCLACGAAAATEIAEPRGWRVPIFLGGALALLAVIGVVLAIVALSGGNEKLAQTTPTPSAAQPPPATATPTTTTTPVPTATATPSASPTESPTTTPGAGATATPSPNSTTGTGASSFADWPGGTGWTVIIESATARAKAETVATEAQGKGHTVGILHSDDYSSLNPGYYVVFTQKYASRKAAQAGRDLIKGDYPDAYVRRVKP
jgi:cell division septation protein DedD